MADEQPQLSPGMQALSAAIRSHGGPRAAFCGFDLWLDSIRICFLFAQEVVKGTPSLQHHEPVTDPSKLVVLTGSNLQG